MTKVKFRLTPKVRRLSKWAAGLMLLLLLPWIVQKIALPRAKVNKLFSGVRERHLKKVEAQTDLWRQKTSNSGKPSPLARRAK